MADKFGQETRFPRNFQGSVTCRKSATWDRRLYFPSEGRLAENFFARNIRRLRPGLNPRSWVPEASTLTTRPPKPLPLVSSCTAVGDQNTAASGQRPAANKRQTARQRTVVISRRSAKGYRLTTTGHRKRPPSVGQRHTASRRTLEGQQSAAEHGPTAPASSSTSISFESITVSGLRSAANRQAARAQCPAAGGQRPSDTSQWPVVIGHTPAVSGLRP
jgi:hypothetical protein